MIFWFIIVVAQLIFNYGIVYRYFDDPALNLVNVLSLANISVAILDTRYT